MVVGSSIGVRVAKAHDAFNVPKSLLIGYRQYTVKYKPRAKSEIFGECDTDGAEITVFGHKDGPSIANTLLHEAFHAMYKEARLQDRVGEENEEDIIRTMTDNLCQFFVNNPQATKWLLVKLGVLDAAIPTGVLEQEQAVRGGGSVAPAGPAGPV